MLNARLWPFSPQSSKNFLPQSAQRTQSFFLFDRLLRGNRSKALSSHCRGNQVLFLYSIKPSKRHTLFSRQRRLGALPRPGKRFLMTRIKLSSEQKKKLALQWLYIP